MDSTIRRPFLAKPVIALVLVFVLICIVGGALFYYYVEGLSPVDAFYFASMTLATVGYGDFVPKTDVGKIFTAFYAFIGIGTFFGFGAILFQSALSRVNQIHLTRKEKSKGKS